MQCYHERFVKCFSSLNFFLFKCYNLQFFSFTQSYRLNMCHDILHMDCRAILSQVSLYNLTVKLMNISNSKYLYIIVMQMFVLCMNVCRNICTICMNVCKVMCLCVCMLVFMYSQYACMYKFNMIWGDKRGNCFLLSFTF